MSEKTTSRFEALDWYVQLASGGTINIGAAVAAALDQFCEDIVIGFEPNGAWLCTPSAPERASLEGKPAISISAYRPQERFWTSTLEDDVTAPVSLESILINYAEREARYMEAEGVPDAMSKALIQAAEAIEKVAATLRQRAVS